MSTRVGINSERNLENMKNVVTQLVVFLAIAIIGVVTVSAETITFDDLPYVTSYEEIPDGYKDKDWTNMYYIHEDYHPGSGYDNGIVSGEFGAFNGWGAIASASAGDVFMLESAYFTAAWTDDLIVGVEGFLSGTLMYNTLFEVNSKSPTFVDFSTKGWLGGVDTIQFTSYKDNLVQVSSQFLMDDLSIKSDMVPEPATIFLFGIGLMGMAKIGRRRA